VKDAIKSGKAERKSRERGEEVEKRRERDERKE
jgi:hypothetical protein